MEREKALELLKTHLSNPNTIKHSLAVEAVMRALAQRLGEDPDVWGIAGLLHDIDYEMTGGDPYTHGLVGYELLLGEGLYPDAANAVIRHNEQTGHGPETLFDHALRIADPVTGLIVAAALVRPEKKLAAVETEFVIRKMAEKSFAKGASRERIRACDDIGIPLEEYIALSIKAMQGIAGELGL